jgi:hypothetical protein
MSISISISDGMSGRLERAAQILGNRRRLNRAMAEGALPVVQNHFRSLSATNRNPYGARPRFWNRMLSSTKADSTESAAILRMPAEVGFRYRGGTLRPVKAKYLTIPARSESYGKSARDFNDLEPVAFDGPRGKMLALVQRNQTVITRAKSGKRKGEITKAKEIGGGVYFWLVRSVNIRGNKNLAHLN